MRIEPARGALVVHVTMEHHTAMTRQAARALADESGLSAVSRNGEVGLEVVCQDDGPGIPDVKRAVQDGFIVGGGPGGGLPGMERPMDEFEITLEVG